MSNKEVITKLKGLQQLLAIANEYDAIPSKEDYNPELFGEVLLDNYSEYVGSSPSDMNSAIRIAVGELEEEVYELPTLVSFSDLTIGDKCNVSDEVVKHTSQAGSIFPHRANALKELEIAKDNVKAVLGRIEMDTHGKGIIPHPDKDIKITGAAMTAYVNSHSEVIQARKERAEAEHHYDNVKAVVTAYLGKKELLQLMMSDRKNEFYSDPVIKAETETGLTNFDQK